MTMALACLVAGRAEAQPKPLKTAAEIMAALSSGRSAGSEVPASDTNQRRLRVDIGRSFCRHGADARADASYFDFMNASISATVRGRPGVRFSQPVSVMTMVSSTRTPSFSSAKTA